jgi:hypothetical protein
VGKRPGAGFPRTSPTCPISRLNRC